MTTKDLVKRVVVVAALAVLFAMPAAAQKVTIDYAHGYDFQGVKTFQYVDTPESNSSNPLLNDRIKADIIAQLKAGGLTEVTENPDIYVTYHLTTKQNAVYNTTSFGYGGWGPGWGGWGGMGGIGSSTTTQSSYTEGTLIIDAYNASDKKMVWRGTGTVTVKDSPQKQSKQVDKVLTKLGKKWKKILANQGE